MATRFAINGCGRIGRCIWRCWQERQLDKSLQLVAVNDILPPDSIAYLLRHDSAHGFADITWRESDASFSAKNEEHRIAWLSESDPQHLPWKALDIDLVLECSGQFTTHKDLQQHLIAGARRVMLSAPGEPSLPVVVHGVNTSLLKEKPTIFSAASCTSNAAAPVLKVLDDQFGIESGLLTTIHSIMNDQPSIDGGCHNDLRRNRAASASIVPVGTELASGITRILPNLAGKLSASVLRVPVLNVSAMVVGLQLAKATNAKEVNAILQEASTHALAGILACEPAPLVSCDFNHNPHSAIVDTACTQSSTDHLLKLLLWFDNEWGYVNRMLDLALHL